MFGGGDTIRSTISGAGLGLAVGAILFLLAWARLPIDQLHLEQNAVRERLELARYPGTPIEERAERLFRSNQAELERYYGQARVQSQRIFYTGLIAMAGGVAIIFAVMALVFYAPDARSDDKVLAVILGSVGTIATNVVAAIFLAMYSQTTRSLSDFHLRLVTTHHLHFGNVLAAKIEDIGKREDTLARMAETVSKAQLEEAVAASQDAKAKS